MFLLLMVKCNDAKKYIFGIFCGWEFSAGGKMVVEESWAKKIAVQSPLFTSSMKTEVQSVLWL